MLRVLIVDDEPHGGFEQIACVAHFLGFIILAQTGRGPEAMRQLRHGRVDLVLIDIDSPTVRGLELLRMIRSHGYTNDVITAIRGDDPAALRASLCYGALHCLVKPISFTVLRQSIERYRNYHGHLARCCGQLVGQAEVDELMASLSERDHGHLPKGVCAETLDSVVGELCAADRSSSLSATEVARIMGTSRVTSRRYLEYLADAGLARRDMRYGGPGRPEVRYRWRQPRPQPGALRIGCPEQTALSG